MEGSWHKKSKKHLDVHVEILYNKGSDPEPESNRNLPRNRPVYPKQFPQALKLALALCLLTAPIFAWAQVSDDFSSLELDPAVWVQVDPVGGSGFESVNGWLTLTIPGGTDHDLREGINGTARLVQDVPDDDFSIDVGFESLPTEDFQIQGLLAETDATHYLHLDVRRTGQATKVVCATVDGVLKITQGEIELTGANVIRLRLARTGDSWLATYSLDGVTWIDIIAFDHEMTVSRVGVFAGNAGTGGGGNSGVTNLTATQVLSGNLPGNVTAVDLSWTPSVDPEAVSVSLYRKGHDGVYPEYDGGSGPPLPQDPLAEGWEFVATVPVGSNVTTDFPTTRDFWYYCAQANDSGGNPSGAVMTTGVLNYLLGDVSDGGAPIADGDNRVTVPDLILLGSHYFTYEGGPTGLYLNYLDIGPTDDMSVVGRPTADNRIDFEDLIVMSINFEQDLTAKSFPPVLTGAPSPADNNSLALDIPDLPGMGQTFTVNLAMMADGQIQGLQIPLLWDEDVIEFMDFQGGALLEDQGGQSLFFSPLDGVADIALAGLRERGISGKGTLAQATFRVIGTGPVGLKIGDIKARDRANQSVTVNTGGGDDSDRELHDPIGDKSGPIGDKILWTDPAPAFSVQVDYFFDTGAPIVPEDGNIQNGLRVADDLQVLYAFGEGVGDVVLDHAVVLPRLDLFVADPANVDWLPGGGLDLTTATLIASPGPAVKVTDACTASDEVTVEAWVQPATIDQSGPARMFTVSADPGNRNVTLAHGQHGGLPNDVFVTRLRTTTTSLNGQPETISPAGSLTGDLQHVVFTYDAAGITRLYVDGVETASETIGGSLDSWDGSYRLGIGAEMDGTRPWLGIFHLAAIYNRALSPQEIAINLGAGPRGGQLSNLPPAVSLVGISPGEEFDYSNPVPLAAVAGDVGGSVTRVDFYVGNTFLGSDLSAPFEFAWADPAVGSHQIRAVAEDNDGNTTASDVIPILVSTPESYLSALFVSDDFFDAALGQPWTVTDGTAGAAISQVGGHVLVDLPPVTQDPWTLGAASVFAHQAENDGDLAVELKLATVDFTGDTFGGLRLEGGGGEVVQLLGEIAGGTWTLSWGRSDGGPFTDLGALAVPLVTDGLWLQVRRESGAWTFLYSIDAVTWQALANPIQPMALVRCGWVAGGLDEAGGSPTVAFDYAFNLASPVIPEDGGSGEDLIPPVIGEVTVEADLDQATVSWDTDEPTFYRLSYGLTTDYELDVLLGQAFQTSHNVDVTGLAPGQLYHFKVTCVDTAGNVSSTSDMVLYTGWEAVLSPGPAAGDVYRETRLAIYQGNDWRVTDPDALADGAQLYLPNPVLSIEVPDLTGAVRAEMIIDRWGGHPGTSNKRVRLGGGSWMGLPELAAIPASNPECYVYQDNLMIDVPLNQLQTGTMTLEGTADDQICFSFQWGQWGWYGVVLRVYYDGSVAHPTGSILSPTAGDTIVDAASITVSASAAGTVEEVQVLAWYGGADIDGNGVFTEWQREYHRGKSDTSVSIGGIVGSLNVGPWDFNWDAQWIPDQQPGAVKLQARILDDAGLWYVTDFVENLSLAHSDGVVKMYTMDTVPPYFWVRIDRIKTAEFTIPAGDDLLTASAAQMVVPTWNGIDTGVIDINGLWQRTHIGADHFYAMDTYALPTSSLIQDVNTVTITASTGGHGMEVLWPGPMFFVR